jgi:hypothetical protein
MNTKRSKKLNKEVKELHKNCQMDSSLENEGLVSLPGLGTFWNCFFSRFSIRISLLYYKIFNKFLEFRVLCFLFVKRNGVWTFETNGGFTTVHFRYPFVVANDSALPRGGRKETK